jgi:hypothetical protein
MTECNQSQFEFEVHFSRRVVAQFSGELLTPEGGALLLRAADRKIGLLRRVVSCFTDARDPQRIAHELSEMLVQRDSEPAGILARDRHLETSSSVVWSRQWQRSSLLDGPNDKAAAHILDALNSCQFF